MNYLQTLEWLYQATPAFHLLGGQAYKPGLQNMQALMDGLGNPERALKAVHIAGTNGKGSTSHLIAASLQAAGKRVGLYTSPHLVDYRERIRINGQPVPEQAVVAFVEAHQTLIERIQPSFFEITTALAFDYFCREKVDIAVIECGLGGRLDSTNILTGNNVLLSVITNIGFDHTEFLGNTLADIAGEKAGIIKPRVPVVIGETDPETAPVFRSKSDLLTDDGFWFADQCTYMRRCRERDIPVCELKGDYQIRNQQTAYVALKALGVPTMAIKEGFENVCSLTGLRGRWETLQQNPLVICDTGHNSHGIKYVVEQLDRIAEKSNPASLQEERLFIVFGMVADKDVDVVLDLFRKKLPDAEYYFTQARTKRAIPAEQLRLHMGKGRSFATVAEAVEAVLKEASDKDTIFIGGSNYVVGEALCLPNFCRS